MTTLLQPGRISPTRKVPAHIERPEYVGKKTPKTGEPDVKTPEIIERMRVAGRLAAQALEEVGRHVAPGVTTDELDRIGHEFLCDHGAYPSTLGYRGYPKSLCTSINEVICHGIPDDTVLRDGDIVNVDITAFIGGVHGDTDATFLVGEVDEMPGLILISGFMGHGFMIAPIMGELLAKHLLHGEERELFERWNLAATARASSSASR